jgi:predicted nucleic acid-binding protein
MYLLDTNIVSLFDPRRAGEAAAAIEWLRKHDSLLFVSTITLTEIEAGILKLMRERKEARARQIIGLRDGLIADFSKRLLPLSVEAALTVARLAERVRPMTIERTDLIIAATASVHGLVVLTRNLRHFEPTGVPTIDPVKSLPKSGQQTNQNPGARST